jgi:hypothetical protein
LRSCWRTQVPVAPGYTGSVSARPCWRPAARASSAGSYRTA